MLILFTLTLLLFQNGVIGTCVDESRDCAFRGQPVCKNPDAYNGTKSTTHDGLPCLNWKDIKHSSYNENHNYCRNPDSDSKGPWCFRKVREAAYCFQDCPTNNPTTTETATFNCSGKSDPEPRKHDPSLEFFSRKTLERESHCPKYDGRKKIDRENAWKIDNVTAAVEAVEGGKVVFTIDNRTPRDFETLKLRIFLSQADSMPIDLEVGQIVQFTQYRFNRTVQGVRNKEDITSVQFIDPMRFYKIGIDHYESICTKCTSGHTEVTVQHEKNYAHAIANIHYLVNSPEFRKDFMVERSVGISWMERQFHLDWVLTEQKYRMRLGTLSLCRPVNGIGGGTWVAIQANLHRPYKHDINGEFVRALAHELFHAWGYGHADFVMKMEIPMKKQLVKFNEQCVVQRKIAPQERYTDFVGLNGVFNPKEKAVYVFSGYTFRILSLKDWSESNVVMRNECISKDPLTGRDCVTIGSSACKGDKDLNKTTTVFGTPCKDNTRCTISTGKQAMCDDAEGTSTYCYPPCTWKSYQPYDFLNGMVTLGIYDAHGQVNVESRRHCVRYDESCAWNDTDNCKRYGAYSGKKATTIGGEDCKPWKETEYKNFEGNFCRATPDKAPWCYKVSGGWDYCFSNCESKPVDFELPKIKDNEELSACLDEVNGQTCAWNQYQKCKGETNMYEKTTTLLGEPCKTGTKCKSGNGSAPGCKRESDGEWDKCFPDCLTELCFRRNKFNGNYGKCFLGEDRLCLQYLGDQVFDKKHDHMGFQCDPNHNGGRCIMQKGDSRPPWCIFNGKKSPCFKTCTRHTCLKKDESCAWNKRDICKSDSIDNFFDGNYLYAGAKKTYANGVPCEGDETCRSVRFNYEVRAPSCKHFIGGKDVPKLCFNDCYEPSQDERSLVERVYKDITTGVKFSFLDTSTSEEQIGIVPFVRGRKLEEDRILYYSLDQKSLTLKRNESLKDVLGGLWGPGRTLFNPQFLQGVGVFHGAQFCNFTVASLGPCTNVYTDPNWEFLTKFAAGPAELDLVFDGGYKKAFFFKEKEFIVYDLITNKMVSGYPKPVSTFLHHFGLDGQSFVALS